jgi:ubiquinone/menaquinone biosynthesis C-methylase UbiE
MATTANKLSPEDAQRLRTFERRRHDTLAETYTDFFASVTAFAIKPLLAAAHAGPGTALLEVATGSGALAAEARQCGASPIGVDLSPRMVELAKKRYPGIDFRVAEVERLPFADDTFDAVICGFGLGHFPFPEASLAECVRTLKPGGWVALSWWGDPSRQRVQGLFRDAIAEIGAEPPPDVPKGYTTLRFCDTGEFLRLLEGAGLEDISVRDHETTHMVADVDTLWRGGLGGMAMTAGVVVHQDAAKQQAIRAALERRVAAYQTTDGLKIPIAFKIGAGRKPS